MRIRLFTPPGPLTYDMLNQRQLTLLKFRRHKLAVAAAFLLAGLYIMALFSPFSRRTASTSGISTTSTAPRRSSASTGRRGCTPKGSGGWSIRSR